MKRIVFLILMTVGLATAATAAPQAKQLSALFSYSTFYLPESGPYVESYISFDAWNVNFVKADGGYQAAIEIVLVVRKDDSIEHAKRYNLLSPVISSPDSNRFTFLDLQRLALGNGIHDIEITMHDINSTNEAVSINQKVFINYDKKTPRLSSVKMMNSVRRTIEVNIL